MGARQEQPSALNLRDSNFDFMIPENFDKKISNVSAHDNVGKKLRIKRKVLNHGWSFSS